MARERGVRRGEPQLDLGRHGEHRGGGEVDRAGHPPAHGRHGRARDDRAESSERAISGVAGVVLRSDGSPASGPTTAPVAWPQGSRRPTGGCAPVPSKENRDVQPPPPPAGFVASPPAPRSSPFPALLIAQALVDPIRGRYRRGLSQRRDRVARRPRARRCLLLMLAGALMSGGDAACCTRPVTAVRRWPTPAPCFAVLGGFGHFGDRDVLHAPPRPCRAGTRPRWSPSSTGSTRARCSTASPSR